MPLTSCVYDYSYYANRRELPEFAGVAWQGMSQLAALPDPFIFVNQEVLYVSFSNFTFESVVFPWCQRVTYCSHVTPHCIPGETGAQWFLSNLPFLIESTDSHGRQHGIELVGSLSSRLYFFESDDGIWTSAQHPAAILEYDFITQSLKLEQEGSESYIFFSFDSNIPRQLRGKLQSVISSDSEHSARVMYEHSDSPVGMRVYDGENQYEVVYEQTHDAIGICYAAASIFKDDQPQVRIRYQYDVLNSDHRAQRFLKGINFERYAANGWMIQRRVHFKYAKNHAQLREVKIWSANTPNASHDSELQSCFSEYEINYDTLGNVIWVKQIGPGPEPMYLD